DSHQATQVRHRRAEILGGLPEDAGLGVRQVPRPGGQGPAARDDTAAGIEGGRRRARARGPRSQCPLRARGTGDLAMRIALIACLLLRVAAAQDIVRDVRAAIAQNNFSMGEGLIRKYKAARGTTPEMVEAVSWLGRGALAAKQLDRAAAYAAEARKLALDQLKRRNLDAEPHLPLALGASIEVDALVMDGRGERDEAVTFLRRELKTWSATSIRTRIQTNIHVLGLEGKAAPA